jgi:uncharacterized membrane protein
LRKRATWKDEPSIWYVSIGLGLLVLAGGGTPIWARALVLLVTGIWIAISPPRDTPSRWFEIGLLALLVVSLISSFAPTGWFGHPSWRVDAYDLGIALPKTNAVIPWLAAEAVAQWLAGIAWLYACWNLRLNHDSRKHALWALAALTAVLAVGAIFGNFLGIKYPLSHDALGYLPVNFSYFPNRNQSALWFCIGGVAAFGVLLESLRRRRGRSLVAGWLLLPCLLALVMQGSRMAMLLFGLGAVLVVVVRLGRDAGHYTIRILLPLGIFLLSLLMFFGGDTLQRLPIIGGGGGGEQDFRISLWRDTFSLVKEQPVGVGLGQFAEVFPQYRFYAHTYQSVLHPDSDWVWLFGETGWLGVLAAAVAVGGLIAVFFSKEGRESSPYRHMAALCAGLFLLHSLVDVPAHRFGTWLLAGWLVALAAPEKAPVASLVPRWVWRGAGVVLLGVSILWLAAAFAGTATSSILVEDRAMARTDQAIKDGDPNAALQAANDAVVANPLLWRPYTQRARTLLTMLNDPADALADFRRARFVEPIWAKVPYTEGQLWLPYDPVQAVAAWREALQRDVDVPEGLWRNIHDQLLPLPNGEDYASLLSKSRPLFRFEFLQEVSPARFVEEWADEMQRDPALAQYTPTQRESLLLRWAMVDGPATLNYLKGRPNIGPDFWLVEAYALASAANFADAFSLARQHLEERPIPDISPSGPADIETLQANYEADSGSLERGVVLLRAQLDAAKAAETPEALDAANAAALKTLDQMAEKIDPAPLFIAWWRADLDAKAGHLDLAWAAIQPYLEDNYKSVLKH